MDKDYRKGQTRIDFYLDDETYAKVVGLCKEHGITKSDFMRKALKHFIVINTLAAKKGD